eukprot:Tamp_24705.p2 GENE.Tamp_24705~~Tamp_24705.p2  ORF type:complete len:103 (-),score=6.69 Tamp_24705:221-529(-)
MFSPNPPSESYWIVIPAIFRRSIQEGRPRATRNLFALGGPVRSDLLVLLHNATGYRAFQRPQHGWPGTYSAGLQSMDYAHMRWHKFFDNYWGNVKDKVSPSA